MGCGIERWMHLTQGHVQFQVFMSDVQLGKIHWQNIVLYFTNSIVFPIFYTSMTNVTQN